jgi:hypothetical protein
MEKEEAARVKRSNTYVIFQVVIKCTERHHILELIFDGTQGKGHLCVPGFSVVKDLQGQTNYKDIEELIQVR